MSNVKLVSSFSSSGVRVLNGAEKALTAGSDDPGSLRTQFPVGAAPGHTQGLCKCCVRIVNPPGERGASQQAAPTQVPAPGMHPLSLSSPVLPSTVSAYLAL